MWRRSAHRCMASKLSTSLVVISRGVARYVTEFSTECAQSLVSTSQHGNIGSDTEQSEANIELRTAPFITSSERTDESYTPIHDREWQHVPSLDNVLAQFLPCQSRRQVGSSTVLTMNSNTANEVVTSRGVDRYVTELSAECTQPVHARCWSLQERDTQHREFSARMEHTRSCQTLAIKNSSQ